MVFCPPYLPSRFKIRNHTLGHYELTDLLGVWITMVDNDSTSNTVSEPPWVVPHATGRGRAAWYSLAHPARRGRHRATPLELKWLTAETI